MKPLFGSIFSVSNLRGFAQAAAVVGEKGLVDEIGGGNVLADAERIKPRIRREFVLCHDASLDRAQFTENC